jgi:hypothetical protein
VCVCVYVLLGLCACERRAGGWIGVGADMLGAGQ